MGFGRERRRDLYDCDVHGIGFGVCMMISVRFRIESMVLWVCVWFHVVLEVKREDSVCEEAFSSFVIIQYVLLGCVTVQAAHDQV